MLIDISGFAENPPEEEYNTLIKELELFSKSMLQKARVVALTKLDTVTEFEPLDELQQQLESIGETVFRVSSISGEGVQELVHYLANIVKKERQRDNQKSCNSNSESVAKNTIWND